MDVLVVTSVRLLAESLSLALSGQGRIQRLLAAAELGQAESLLKTQSIPLVLIDVSAGIDKQRMRELALRWTDVRFLAVGVEEHRDAVVNCGRMGFTGYVPRDAGIEALRRAVLDCGAGRLTCSAEMASHLMRALLSRAVDEACESSNSPSLTNRECDVSRLLNRGFSNKEIARELDLSVATVKHHVHNVLAKRNVSNRIQLISAQARRTSA